MAVTTVAFDDLRTWLQNQPMNTPDTPYELNITGLYVAYLKSSDTNNTLGWELNQQPSKYVDLSATQLPSQLSDMTRTFRFCSNLVKSPTIPSNVTNMQDTFDLCTALKIAPTIPNGVTNITNAFAGCKSLLVAPNIPNSVITMNDAFSGCTQLTTPSNIPSSVTDASSAYSRCTSLTVPPTISNGVTSLSSVFDRCTSLLTAPIIPNSVTNLAYAFFGCTALQNPPALPDNVKNVNSTFYNCSSLLYKPVIPSTVTKSTDVYKDVTQTVWGGTKSQLESWLSQQTSGVEVKLIEANTSENRYDIVSDTFYGVTVSNLSTFLEELSANTVLTPYNINVFGLTSSNLSDLKDALENNLTKYVDLHYTELPSITSLSNTFEGCYSLIIPPQLPSGLISLIETFKDCVFMKEAPEIPSSVEVMSATFESCAELEEAPTLSSGLLQMPSLFKNCVKLSESPTIPNGVTSVQNAFESCTLLEEMPTIPSGVTSLSSTFKNCTSLTEIEIPSGVTNIESAFEGCTGIIEIESVPSSVTSGASAFKNCTSLEKIDEFGIPVSSLDSSNFQDMFAGCNALTQIGYKIDESEQWHVFRLKFGNDTVEGEIFDKDGVSTDINEGTAVSITKSSLTLPVKTDEVWFPDMTDIRFDTDAKIDAVIAKVLQYKYSYFKKAVLPPEKKSFVLWADDPDNFETNLEIGSDIPVYATQAQAEADLPNLAEGTIIATEIGGDGVIDEVLSGDTRAVTSGAVSEALSYSTEEVFTGSYWIDGKKIYKKVIQGNSIPSGNIIGSIGNYSDVISINGVVINSSNNDTLPINYNGQLYCAVKPNGNVSFNQGSITISKFRIVINYTKTTDTATRSIPTERSVEETDEEERR